MMTKTIFKGIRGLRPTKAAPLIVLLALQGTQVLAQSQQPTATSQNATEGISAVEILGYVAMIVGVILLAWVIGSMQTKKPTHDATIHNQHRRAYDHPNDPHFRRLKKKTS